MLRGKQPNGELVIIMHTRFLSTASMRGVHENMVRGRAGRLHAETTTSQYFFYPLRFKLSDTRERACFHSTTENWWQGRGFVDGQLDLQLSKRMRYEAVEPWGMSPRDT